MITESKTPKTGPLLERARPHPRKDELGTPEDRCPSVVEFSAAAVRRAVTIKKNLEALGL